MRVAFVVTLLGVATVPSFQDEICVAKDRLAFESYFTKTVRPQVPNKTCAHDISAYRALQAAQSPCLQGYARHSNGRCYRVVDKSQDGGPGITHEYRITYRAVCSQHWEPNASELETSQTLDFCDEDGGCIEVLKADDEEERTVAVSTCVSGYIRDAYGICRKAVSPFRRYRRSSNESTTPAAYLPDAGCVAGYILDAGGVCRKAVAVPTPSNQKPVGSVFGSVPDGCAAGYVMDADGICRKVVNPQ